MKPHGQNAKGIKASNLTQSESNIQFLRCRAAANGFDLFTHDGVIYFGPQRLTAISPHNIKVCGGRETNCINLQITNDVHRADIISFDLAAEDSHAVKPA